MLILDKSRDRYACYTRRGARSLSLYLASSIGER